MTAPVAVVVPAQDEARRIGGCLQALAAQHGPLPAVVLVVNGTTDDTAACARQVASERGLDLTLIETPALPGGVGAARALGCDAALERGARHLLTTDADALVAPDWVGRATACLERFDAVCGRIEGIEAEARGLPERIRIAGAVEEAWMALTLEFEALVAPDPHNPYPHHGQSAGANIGVRAAAYLAAGGFAARPSGEDRDLVHRLRFIGCTVRHADDVRVQASCRLIGRAPGGMADTLRRRSDGDAASVDPMLRPLDAMIARHLDGLAVWPPGDPAPGDVMSRAAALRGLPGLRRCLTTLRALPDPATRLDWLARRRRRPPLSPPPDATMMAVGPGLSLRG